MSTCFFTFLVRWYRNTCLVYRGAKKWPIMKETQKGGVTNQFISSKNKLLLPCEKDFSKLLLVCGNTLSSERAETEVKLWLWLPCMVIKQGYFFRSLSLRMVCCVTTLIRIRTFIVHLEKLQLKQLQSSRKSQVNRYALLTLYKF